MLNAGGSNGKRGARGLAALVLVLGVAGVAMAAVTPQMVWKQKSPASSPAARRQMGMAYDEDRHQVVLFGGTTGSGPYFGDTWTYDGTNWTQKFPANAPSARFSPAMCWHYQDHAVLLFGGGDSSPGGGYRSDTWEWNGTNWTLVVDDCPTCPTHPVNCSLYAAMAPLTNNPNCPLGAVYLFGGYYAGANSQETWQFYNPGSGAYWLKKTSVGYPPARSDHAMAYDYARRAIVMFGGKDATTYFNDTWELSVQGGDVAWSGASSSLTPVARSRHGMVFDSARSVMVMFRGETQNTDWDNTTWEYSPVLAPESNWRPATAITSVVQTGAGSPQCLPLKPRAMFGMAYDAARQVTVMFGGQGALCSGLLNDTWELALGQQDSVPTLVTGMGSWTSDAANRPTIRSWRMTCTGWPPTCTLKPALGTANPTGITYTNTLAYSPYEYGVNVAAGDIGVTDPPGATILTAPGAADDIGSNIKGWKWYDGTKVPNIDFFAYPGTTGYGAKVATGHTGCALCTGSYDQILTGAGPSSVFAPQVRGFRYDPVNGIYAINKINFNAYSGLYYGVNVASGNTDADSWDEIITGNGPGATYAPAIKVWNFDNTAISQDTTIGTLAPFAGYNPPYQYGVNVASGNINDSQGGQNNFDDIIAGSGPDPNAGVAKLTAYIISDFPNLRWKRVFNEPESFGNDVRAGCYVTAANFGNQVNSNDLIVAGQGEPDGLSGRTNCVRGFYYDSADDKLKLVDSLYFDAYNIFNGSTVAATDASFQLPAAGAAAQGGGEDLKPVVEVIRQFVLDLPDSTYACDYCKDPAPGTWSVWGSDGQKAATVSAVDGLMRELPKLAKVQRDAMLEDIWNYVSDPKLGVKNEEARYELRDQIDYVKGKP